MRNGTSSGRTPLFRAFRRALRLVAASEEPGAPPARELAAMRRDIGRRAFLGKAGASAAVPALLSSCVGGPEPGAGGPRIAVIGAGLAGLTAAYELRKRGLRATVYEAARRTGGRAFSRRNIMGPGLVTEIGGSFIDTDHIYLRCLCGELGLELWDTGMIGTDLQDIAYFFPSAGGMVPEDKVMDALEPVVKKIKTLRDRIEADRQRLEPEWDRKSMKEYFDVLGIRGWLRDLFTVAYVTEFGLDVEEQSCLNLVNLFDTPVDKFERSLFDMSDERFKVAGGNERVATAMADILGDQVKKDHRLVSVRPRGDGFTLGFRNGSGCVDVDADIVVLAIPFTLLREVDLRVPLPPLKRRAIQELGYGTSGKVMAGVKERVWEKTPVAVPPECDPKLVGYKGYIMSSEAFQLAWDNSLAQEGEAGGFTFYGGGKKGLEACEGKVEVQVARFLKALDKAYPGVERAYNGYKFRWPWPKYAFTKGSYACYTVGQQSTFGGQEIRPVGNLLFAGEHCSSEFQGFLEGAVETGMAAARSIVKRVQR